MASDSTAEWLVALRRQFLGALRASDRRGARRLLRQAVARGVDGSVLMREVVTPAIEEVGRSWREEELSLSQVYAVGLIAEDSLQIAPPSPELAGGRTEKVTIGTARGDYHGLGKRIVAAFLRAAGFSVVDLGMSAAPEALVERALSEGARIIAVSALMADTALGIREVRSEMERQGAADVKLLVGGAPFRYNAELWKLVGADATAPNAYEAVQVARKLLGKRG